MNATEELGALLEARGIEYETRGNDAMRTTSWVANGVQWNFMESEGRTVLTMNHGWHGLTPEQAIAATLGDDGYEARMDELLCRLTNGKWSKSRSYSVDFMVSCVDEAYEEVYAEDAVTQAEVK